MLDLRLTLAQSRSVLWASLLLACGTAHGLGDGGASPDGAASGLDAGRRPDAGAASDAGSLPDAGPRDAGPRGTCDAHDAVAELCPDVLCDGLPTWHWDGEQCFMADCGTCVGDECGLGVSSQSECEAAHASCEAPLCRATGGTWQWWAELCGHYSCGFEPPAICETGMPACDCGPGRNFSPGLGCVFDPTCPDLEPLTTEVLCTSTGGTWDAQCCHSECGVPCAAACALPACTCGPMEIFHPERGCEIGQRCLERLQGESCEGQARCERGTICCDTCGGPGCAGEPTCRLPVCDISPTRDICGNNPIAP